MDFNEKLIKLRKKNGLSQEELGDKLGVARQTISKWELGDTTPEMDKLIKISEIFNISLDDLLKNIKLEKNQDFSNIQKLAGILIVIIKIIGIGILACILISIVSFILFSVNRNDVTKTEDKEIVYENNKRLYE